MEQEEWEDLVADLWTRAWDLGFLPTADDAAEVIETWRHVAYAQDKSPQVVKEWEQEQREWAEKREAERRLKAERQAKLAEAARKEMEAKRADQERYAQERRNRRAPILADSTTPNAVSQNIFLNRRGFEVNVQSLVGSE